MGESDRYGRQRRSNLHVKENLKKKTEEAGQSNSEKLYPLSLCD